MQTEKTNETVTSTTPLPDSTIFMFGWSYEVLVGAGEEAPACEPIGYWTDPDELLKWVAKDRKSDIAPIFQLSLHVGRPCDVYLIHNRLGNDLYIYVWAITPAGGAA